MIRLYGHEFSSYTWKALIPLYACGIEHRFCDVDPGTPDNAENSAFVQQAHPAGKFPVLRDGNAVVVEATAIIEFWPHITRRPPVCCQRILQQRQRRGCWTGCSTIT